LPSLVRSRLREGSGKSGSPDVATIAMTDASAAMPQWAPSRPMTRARPANDILANQHQNAIYWPEKGGGLAARAL